MNSESLVGVKANEYRRLMDVDRDYKALYDEYLELKEKTGRTPAKECCQRDYESEYKELTIKLGEFQIREVNTLEALRAMSKLI